MSASFLRRPSLAILGVALSIHLMMIFGMPRAIMWFVMDRAGMQAGTNHPIIAPPTDQSNRFVPLVSPDFIYAVCVLDLYRGPMQVSLTPGDAYVSVALFDADARTQLAVNDQTPPQGPINLLVSSTTADAPGTPAPPAPPGWRSVRVSTDRAMLLVRGLAATPALASVSDTVRHSLRCARAKP